MSAGSTVAGLTNVGRFRQEGRTFDQVPSSLMSHVRCAVAERTNRVAGGYQCPDRCWSYLFWQLPTEFVVVHDGPMNIAGKPHSQQSTIRWSSLPLSAWQTNRRLGRYLLTSIHVRERARSSSSGRRVMLVKMRANGCGCQPGDRRHRTRWSRCGEVSLTVLARASPGRSRQPASMTVPPNDWMSVGCLPVSGSMVRRNDTDRSFALGPIGGIASPPQACRPRGPLADDAANVARPRDRAGLLL